MSCPIQCLFIDLVRQDLVMSEGIVFLIILALLGPRRGSIFTLQLREWFLQRTAPSLSSS